MVENRPSAGARYEADLPKGEHELQLYSLGTPNGQKVTIALEELGLPYDAHFVNIMKGEQFSSGFTKVNLNGKIPALVDYGAPGGEPLPIFESGAILMYLAEKVPESGLLPKDPVKRSVALQWLFFQVGTGPYLGNFGHFFKYAKEKIPYGIERFSMETKRILDVLDKRLEKNEFLAGSEYTIADIANFPWVVCLDLFYGASEELELSTYKNVARWREAIASRPAVKIGMQVNGFASPPELQNYSTNGSKK
eukprot:CAMPEP_0198330850 /NCGR_PEP_ID=MMETSP1450-20131203/17201_1 /TAXON_ID=753684 ORGANISM="Madagascaria erythrocladiodes, Strain CCMP3234" /NCGR_SAMPLE_ID=MMETSP1450 /ASSEMBLY_ACC=CAM_ASM_001115 /LENGTH=250 /DNA_ID=CAMNT_0044035181 /DNA_START=65 /DNA_END=817 /DNA_ORIENTATION=+